VTTESLDPDFATAAQDRIRTRFVGNERDRCQFAEFSDDIFTKLIRALLSSEWLNVNPFDWSGGWSLPDKRGSGYRTAERKTDGQPEWANFHDQDYPPKPSHSVDHLVPIRQRRFSACAIYL
jgi:hypothetical protein